MIPKSKNNIPILDINFQANLYNFIAIINFEIILLLFKSSY